MILDILDQQLAPQNTSNPNSWQSDFVPYKHGGWWQTLVKQSVLGCGVTWHAMVIATSRMAIIAPAMWIHETSSGHSCSQLWDRLDVGSICGQRATALADWRAPASRFWAQDDGERLSTCVGRCRKSNSEQFGEQKSRCLDLHKPISYYFPIGFGESTGNRCGNPRMRSCCSPRVLGLPPTWPSTKSGRGRWCCCRPSPTPANTSLGDPGRRSGTRPCSCWGAARPTWLAGKSFMTSRSSWWFGTWILWLSIYWEFHHPNWRTHIFQRGRLNHQPEMIFRMNTSISRIFPSHVWLLEGIHHWFLNFWRRLRI